MARLLTELIGTFFLVLTVGLTAVSGTPLAPLAIGSVYMTMVYMGHHVSGGHYNPAVSLAARMRGSLPSRDLVPYWVAQVTGAILAALVVNAALGSTPSPAPAAGASAVSVLLLEFLFTFALCLVVLNTTSAGATERNSYFGLAIGFTLMVGGFAAGPTTGGAFNPAVGIGPILIHAFVGGGSVASLWYYLVGPLAGGAAAALAFRMQHPAE